MKFDKGYKVFDVTVTMRRWAFVIFVLGIFIMFVLGEYYIFEIEGGEGLESLEINSRVRVSGEVISERVIYQGTRLLELDNGINVLCECKENLLTKKLFVVGKVSEYDGRKQIIAEEVLF